MVGRLITWLLQLELINSLLIINYADFRSCKYNRCEKIYLYKVNNNHITILNKSYVVKYQHKRKIIIKMHRA